MGSLYIHIGLDLRANCGRSTRRVSFYGGVVDPSDRYLVFCARFDERKDGAPIYECVVGNALSLGLSPPTR